MKKPLIGVLPLIDYGKKSLWMLPGYMDGIEEAGGAAVMLPLTKDKELIRQLALAFDGFLFTGGQDVSPSLYGEKPLPLCGETSPERDEMELELLRLADEADKPLLGICRGIQFINAALGGSLYQDLPSQHPSALEHHQSPPYDVPAHPVDIMPDTPLSALLKTGKLMVNSYHHQAIKTVASGLKVMAAAPDGTVEAVFRPQRQFFWAVQWHPELSFRSDENSRQIFRAFVDACGITQSVSDQSER